MNERVKKEMQEKIDNLYMACDSYKDQMAVLQFKYNAALAALEKMREETGLDVTQKVCDECLGLA